VLATVYVATDPVPLVEVTESGLPATVAAPPLAVVSVRPDGRVIAKSRWLTDDGASWKPAPSAVAVLRVASGVEASTAVCVPLQVGAALTPSVYVQFTEQLLIVTASPRTESAVKSVDAPSVIWSVGLRATELLAAWV